MVTYWTLSNTDATLRTAVCRKSCGGGRCKQSHPQRSRCNCCSFSNRPSSHAALICNIHSAQQQLTQQHQLWELRHMHAKPRHISIGD